MRFFPNSLGSLAAAVLALAAGAGSPLAGQEELVDRAAFLSHPAIADAAISPDGSWLAFRAPRDDVMHLWVAPVHATDSATAVSQGEANSFYWSRDSEHLLFLRSETGDQDDRLYAVPLDPSGSDGPRALTPDDGTLVRVYALPDTTPARVLIGLNDRDPSAFDVYQVDITTGATQRVQTNPGEISDWVLDRQGRVRIGLRYDLDGGIELVRVDGDDLTPVFYCEPQETCNPLQFHWDDRRVYLETDHGERDLTELILFHPDTFEEEVVERDPEGRVDFGDAVFTPDGDLVATVYHDDTTRVYAQDTVFAVSLEAVTRQLPSGGFSIGAGSRNEALWTVVTRADTVPATTYILNAWTASLDAVGSSRPGLSSGALAPSTWVRYPARDGARVPALLTRPRTTSVTAGPAVIIAHDGPEERERWGFDPLVQFLVNRGYAVLQPNFRGSSGLGKAWRAAGAGGWGTGVMQRDLEDGADYLVGQGLADPERVAIVGTGYGGYAVLAGLAFSPDRFAAGVSVGPISDLPRYLAELPAFELTRASQLYHAIGDPDEPEELERLQAQSPLGSADQITSPVLLVHGLDDSQVSVPQMERMVGALRSSGVELEYLRAPGEGRAFRNESRRIAFGAVLERFLAGHIGGLAQASVPDATTTAIQAMSSGDEGALGAAATAFTAPLPQTDGTRIEAGTFTYLLRVSGGNDLEVVRQVIAASVDGRDAWQVTDSTMVPVYSELEFDPASIGADPSALPPAPPLEPPPGTGNMAPAADTVYVDRSTLMPIERRVGGPLSYRIAFSSDSIVGEYEIADFFDDVAMELQAPVFSDGSGLDLVIAALPLQVGYAVTIRVYDAQLRQIVPLALTVAGASRVQTPAGAYDAFQVSLTPIGVSGAQGRSIFVRQQSPHILLRGESTVPGDASGFSINVELIDVSSR